MTNPNTDRILKAEPDDDTSKLIRWLERKPESADILRLVEKKLGNPEIVVEYSSNEVIKAGSDEIAKGIMEECEIWAETKGKITPFTLQWLCDDREVKTRPFRFVPDSLRGINQTSLPTPDGSPEAWLASLHAASIRKDQIQIGMMESISALFFQLVEHQQQRIAWLEGQEHEVRKLKEELVELTSGDKESEARFNRLMSVLEKGLAAKGAIAQVATAINPNLQRTPGTPG